jgi:hypothetical protein
VEDTNANGVQDAGEAGIAGVTVQLKDTSGNVVHHHHRRQRQLQLHRHPGTYTVAVSSPPATTSPARNQGGNDATDSDINAAGQTAPVTCSPAEQPERRRRPLQAAELGDRCGSTPTATAAGRGRSRRAGVKVTLLTQRATWSPPRPPTPAATTSSPA